MTEGDWRQTFFSQRHPGFCFFSHALISHATQGTMEVPGMSSCTLRGRVRPELASKRTLRGAVKPKPLRVNSRAVPI